MRRYALPAYWKPRLIALGPVAALSGMVLLAGAGVATADTNTGTEKSTMLCNVVLLSPGADVGGCRNVQVTGQDMVKNGTANTSVVDYAKAETVAGLLP
ncbi:hypothetical protein [Streptomyces poonensis]|uniref:Secreted protein n=1 Tax=Streptomyces poonensis TaxID=68255 RepID=A0A918PC27_9ACTN|nr:hypothetical protein [Streptomyces poonensis]GGY95798.1 hypothetical protein GCM10010365_13370 [Streptomyces poonensis]GLJ88868.1 hypothetical protein GCM10017589_14680 [Streptomyces poonensis]